MKYRITIVKIIAFTFIYLLGLLFAQAAFPLEKATATKHAKTCYNQYVCGADLQELYADVEEDQEELDSHSFVSATNIYVCQPTYISIKSEKHKGCNRLPYLVFYFHTDLPPPYTFS